MDPKKISDNLKSRLESQRDESLFEFMFTFYNPFKVCLLILELLNKQIETSVSNKYRIVSSKRLYIAFILKFLENI